MNFIEQNCTFTHEGKNFTNNGAYIVGDVGAVYITVVAGQLSATDWQGNVLGKAKILTTWERYAPSFGRCMWASYQVTMNDGSKWHGRHHMFWQLLKIKRYK